MVQQVIYKWLTNLARKMITEWGMSEKLGNLRYNNDSEEVFLGHSVAQSKNLSDSTAKIIDDEVRFLADEADKLCRKILQDNIEELHIVAKGLLEYETLSGDEIKDLIKGIKPSRDDFDDIQLQLPNHSNFSSKIWWNNSPQTN